MIVGLGCHFSSSGAVPLSRELDPLFRSEVSKPPIRSGGRKPRVRIEHLAGNGAAGGSLLGCRSRFPRRSRHAGGLPTSGQLRAQASTAAINAGLGWAMWRFKADAHGRFLEYTCAPGRPGEPQSTGGEQRRYWQEEMFRFHCFCILIPASHLLSLRHYAPFPGVDFRFGTKPGNSGAKRRRAGMNLIQPSRLHA